MYVNTAVVKALMQLRGISDVALSSLAHVTVGDLRSWLNEDSESSSELVEFDLQLEILRLLGVHGDQPRGDLVHYWRVHENLFSKNSENYGALQVLLRTFGSAQASYLAQESDPMVNFQARAHFGLRFESFLAILEVTSNPLRNISFGPEVLSGLSWNADSLGVLLPEAEFKRLQPGAMRVRSLTQYLTYTAEVKHWERLRESALSQGISAEQVARVLTGESSDTYLLRQSVIEGHASVPAEAIVAPPVFATPVEQPIAAAPRDSGPEVSVAAPAAVQAEKVEAAVVVSAPAAAAVPATEAEPVISVTAAEKVAVEAPVAKKQPKVTTGSPDPMRLFMTPVKPATPTREAQAAPLLKRVV